MKRWKWALLGLLGAPSISLAQASMAAHEHGVAQLMVVLEEETLQMEFEAPAASLIGFEYLPEAAEDRQAFTEGAAALAQPERLFVLPEAAACFLSSVQVHNTLFSDAAHSDHEDHASEAQGDHEGEARHSEFQAQWQWRCHAPENLNALDTQLLQTFPQTHEVRVQWWLHNQQGAQELSAGNTQLQGWD